MNPTVIIGCGDIGRRIAALCRARGETVYGLVRSNESAQCLATAGINAIVADLDQPASLGALPAAPGVIYYLAPPPDHGTTDPRMGHVLAALTRAPLPRKCVLISTSAVYGDCGGAWVDETAPTHPGSARGQRRLDAEQQMRTWGRAHGVPVVVLRVPGIYGPGRLPRARLQQGLPVLCESESPFTNRIHADDLAMICLAAADRGVADAVFNVSDGHPGTMTQYFLAVAAALGLPAPPQVSMDEARRVMSAGMLSYLEESRRMDNRKMLRELGVTLLYPTLAAGLAAAAQSST